MFDESYYQRFYGAHRHRAQGPKDVARLATVVTTIIEATYGPIESVLDVGAGTGLWRDWFAARRPQTRYRSTDVSAYACRQYGHEQRDIARWKARGTFDLVVCQSVLPYLNAKDATRAIVNLSSMAGAFLYLEAITTSDLESVADRNATDLAMHSRSGEWYRNRLSPQFVQIGFGLWAKRDAPVALWELEQAPDSARRSRRARRRE